jgi:ribosome biogenesis GTPase
MRELGLLGAREGFNQEFEYLVELYLNCRYADCGHTREPGCPVLAAVARGELSEERFASFLKLKKESEYHELSYAEKRKRTAPSDVSSKRC